MYYEESFSLDQKDEIKTFFHENGYVVINDVFTTEECKKIYDHIGLILNNLSKNFNIYDYSTYDNISQFINNFGMISRDPNMDNFFLNLRQNKNIHDIGKIFIDNFVVSHDRFIFYRPTRNIKINNMLCDKPEWGTFYKYPGVHLDMDPKLYYEASNDKINVIKNGIDYKNKSDFISEGHIYRKSEELHIQGMINVLNNAEEDGGFVCVPKFHHNFDKWHSERSAKHQFSEIGRYSFDGLSEIDMKYVYDTKRIACRAGSLILWDRRVAHTGKCNASSRPRLGIPLAFTPKNSLTGKMRLSRRKVLQKVINDNSFNVTEIGNDVFDL
jgi:hypothetical protein